MAENLPRLREEIKDISMSDLKDFLESIRKHSDKVGETAMRQVGQDLFSAVPAVAVESAYLWWWWYLSQAQQHRTFNSAVAKQASMGHYMKPVYSLSGQTHTHNGLMMDDTGDEEEADEEVRKHVWVLQYGLI